MLVGKTNCRDALAFGPSGQYAFIAACNVVEPQPYRQLALAQETLPVRGWPNGARVSTHANRYNEAFRSSLWLESRVSIVSSNLRPPQLDYPSPGNEQGRFRRPNGSAD